MSTQTARAPQTAPPLAPDMQERFEGLLDELAAVALEHARRLDEPLTVTLRLTAPGPDRGERVRATAWRDGRRAT